MAAVQFSFKKLFVEVGEDFPENKTWELWLLKGGFSMWVAAWERTLRIALLERRGCFSVIGVLCVKKNETFSNHFFLQKKI